MLEQQGQINNRYVYSDRIIKVIGDDNVRKYFSSNKMILGCDGVLARVCDVQLVVVALSAILFLAGVSVSACLVLFSISLFVHLVYRIIVDFETFDGNEYGCEEDCCCSIFKKYCFNSASLATFGVYFIFGLLGTGFYTPVNMCGVFVFCWCVFRFSFFFD